MSRRKCHNPITDKTETCQAVINQLHDLLQKALKVVPTLPSAPDAMTDPRDPTNIMTLDDAQRLLDELWHTIQSMQRPLIDPRTQKSMDVHEGQELIDLLTEENEFFKRQPHLLQSATLGTIAPSPTSRLLSMR